MTEAAITTEEAEDDMRAPVARLSCDRDDDDSRADARERRDIVSGEVLPENRLIRFAAAPDGMVIPDVAAKLPGSRATASIRMTPS